MRDGTTVDPSHHRGWLVCGFFVFLCCLARWLSSFRVFAMTSSTWLINRECFFL